MDNKEKDTKSYLDKFVTDNDGIQENNNIAPSGGGISGGSYSGGNDGQ